MTSMLQARILSLPGTPKRSNASLSSWKEDLHPLTPHRQSSENFIYVPPRNSSFITRDASELAGFDYDCVQFRTPQRPMSGTNEWGGASPMLSSNIPDESLEFDYLKFDEMYREYEEAGGDVKVKRRSWGFRQFWWRRKKVGRDVVLGSSGKKRKGWMCKKWPQGW